MKLAQTLNIYFESTVGKLRTKECEANFDLNANFRSKNGVDVAIEKYKDHPNVKIIIDFQTLFADHAWVLNHEAKASW